MSASGLNSQLGFVAESTYGTAVTVTKFLEHVSESLQLEVQRIESRGLKAGRRTLLSSQWAAGQISVAGDIELELSNLGQGLLWLHAMGASSSSGSGPYVHCVDEETEILTIDGWKRYDVLQVGDEVLTLNHETGMSEWQPALEVCVFPAERRELVLMEGRGHSSLSTPNHRWPVVAPHGRDGRMGTQRMWKTTETLRVTDRLERGAPCADLPEEAKWSDAFVELVAWFITEGTIRPEGGGVRIAKTLAREDGEHADRIDAALRRVFGAPVESLLPKSEIPRWRRWTENGKTVRFALNAAAGALLTHVAPERVVQRSFLYQLTQAQLELFIRTALTDNFGPTRFVQRDRRSAEAFQLAAILAGHGTSLLHRVNQHQDSWIVTLQRRAGCKPVDADRVARLRGEDHWISRVDHDGIVWCPRTPNGTWLAKRKGSVYFTGNTYKPADLQTLFMTMQVGKPFIGGTVQAFTYTGCKIAGWEVSATAGEIAMVTFNILGQNESTAIALATASYPAGYAPMTFVHGVLSLGGSAIDVRDVTVTADNGLKDDRWFVKGSGLRSQPLESKWRNYTWEASLDFASLTAYNRFVNGTEAAMTLTFTNGANIFQIAGNVRTDGRTPVVEGPDILAQPLSGRFVASGATDDTAISIIRTTSEATATA